MIFPVVLISNQDLPATALIYSWTDALKFKTHMSGDDFRKAEVKNPGRKAELGKLAESVKEDDNHLLIVITPKK